MPLNTVINKVKYINQQIVSLTEYDFCLTINENHESTCGGYSRIFKTIMDHLDIPCAWNTEINVNYMADGVIFSSDYEFKYPILRYNDKSTKNLYEEEIYLIRRYGPVDKNETF